MHLYGPLLQIQPRRTPSDAYFLFFLKAWVGLGLCVFVQKERKKATATISSKNDVLSRSLQAVGVDPLVAGNVIQISFVLGLMILWVFSYVFRVANKEMTYVKQLKVLPP